MKLLPLTSPIGKVSINTSLIAAIAQCPEKKGANNTTIQTLIYVSNSEEPFNILESYDEVIEMIPFLD